jgi:hypothetical protein
MWIDDAVAQTADDEVAGIFTTYQRAICFVWVFNENTKRRKRKAL